MELQLQKVSDDCCADEFSSYLLLKGSGKAFCAGQDNAELTGGFHICNEVILQEHFETYYFKTQKFAKPCNFSCKCCCSS